MRSPNFASRTCANCRDTFTKSSYLLLRRSTRMGSNVWHASRLSAPSWCGCMMTRARSQKTAWSCGMFRMLVRPAMLPTAHNSFSRRTWLRRRCRTPIICRCWPMSAGVASKSSVTDLFGLCIGTGPAGQGPSSTGGSTPCSRPRTAAAAAAAADNCGSATAAIRSPLCSGKSPGIARPRAAIGEDSARVGILSAAEGRTVRSELLLGTWPRPRPLPMPPCTV
mmetsp:Transcript_24296/g.46663  ORF Transcript_24296/g.46663 Transcript_24296/m.46663 type:complete len:223 (-) Transcript_24296:1163-1831(-)